MSTPFLIPDEIKENYKYALQEARKDRPRYLAWIRNEIDLAITLINQFDKVLIIGGIAAKLVKATPTFYNQFLKNYEGEDAEDAEDDFLEDDDSIEVILEYVMNIATATPNSNKGIIPSHADIKLIYDQLVKIKININFWELSAEQPTGNDHDHWLRTMIVQDTINVRGQGYSTHVQEIFHCIFKPHDEFINQYYGFTTSELMETILGLDKLVYSKIGNSFGFMQSQYRFNTWAKEKGYNNSGFFPMPFHYREFAKDNPDMDDPGSPGMTSYSLSKIENYHRIFWVVPQSEKGKKIFSSLSTSFGGNAIFFDSKFKGFPQGDSVLVLKPLICEEDKYYHFSFTLGFRNIFQIAEELIRSASEVYYENYFRSNARWTTKDNRIEEKSVQVFKEMLPSLTFYSSLHYPTTENDKLKDNELDIIGVGTDILLIIEVKAGELNTKSRRGAIKGMKDKLKETIGKGSFQSYRAENYILQTEESIFTYIAEGKTQTLSVRRNEAKKIYKITILLEQLSMVSNQLNRLIDAGIILPEYKNNWIISIYDLLVFRDIVESQSEFTEYLDNRMQLYEREDIVFLDEIGILGYFLDGNFPLGPTTENQSILMTDYEEDIDKYYTAMETGFPKPKKPVRKKKSH